MRRVLMYILLGAAVCIGCNSVPEHVIPPEDMAQLLADIHKGESVVEANRKDFDSDSAKKAFKQSIYLKHDVTAEQVDTSFVWYGQHIEEYIKVYDRVIEILEADIASVKVSGDDVQLAVAGDSADAWANVRHRKLSNILSDNHISFVINRDDNWVAGDVYDWKLKLINNRSVMHWTIAVDYTDGTTEYNMAKTATEGWHELRLISDSTKTASRVYGVAYVDLRTNENVYVDSISLVRTRLDAKKYGRRFNQHKFNYGKSQDSDTE